VGAILVLAVLQDVFFTVLFPASGHGLLRRPLARWNWALRRWLEHRHGPIHALRVKVPVTLHHDGDSTGNRDSYFGWTSQSTSPIRWRG
jgi:hypothetical protein